MKNVKGEIMKENKEEHLFYSPSFDRAFGYSLYENTHGDVVKVTFIGEYAEVIRLNRSLDLICVGEKGRFINNYFSQPYRGGY